MSIPTTDPLAGLERPPGSPEAMHALAANYAAGAEALGHTSQVLIGMVGRLLAQSWSGSAAMACAASCTQDAAAVATAADGYQAGGAALNAFAGKLTAAQSAYDSARKLANQAVADEQQHEAAAQAAPTSPNSPASPPNLLGNDTTLGGGLGILDLPYQSPLRSVARAQAEQAIADAKHAATAAAGQLEATLTPFRPKPPPPPAKPEHHWYSPITNFADGAWDSVKDPVVMVGGLVGLHGDVSDNWSNLGKGLAHGFTHPLDFGKALIDWDDLSKGHYAHWAGELVPSVAAAFLTGGAAAGVKGADAVGAVSKSGKALSDLSDAEKASLLARGEKLVPGSVGASAAAKYTTAGGRLDYSGIVDRELKNFKDISSSGAQVLDEDRYLVNLHDASTPLNDPRSLKYGAPLDSVLADTRGGYLQKSALVPQWGARDGMSIIKIPAGTHITTTEGTTALQISKHDLSIAGHKIEVPTGVKVGGGPQTLLHDVDTDWVVWTGKAPWADGAYNIPRGVAGAGAGGVVTRVPDVLSDLAASGAGSGSGSGG